MTAADGRGTRPAGEWGEVRAGPTPSGLPAIIDLDAATAATMLPARDRRAHKGTHGSLVALCGSPEYVGAALLVALAAARAGCGLVSLGVPRSLQPVVAGRVPEAVTLALTEAGDDVDPLAAFDELRRHRADAYLAGPGVRETEAMAVLLRRLLGPPEVASASGSAEPGRPGDGGERAPAVVDGGGLNLLARTADWWKAVGRPLVLTPHPREFGRLTGRPVSDDDGERVRRASEAAAGWRQVVVLKGARTIVAGPDGRLARAPFENPALATAGSGDVLAGVIASLLAQGVAPLEAACLGVYLHGAAGERLRERIGDAGVLASDLPFEVALARTELAASAGAPAAGPAAAAE